MKNISMLLDFMVEIGFQHKRKCHPLFTVEYYHLTGTCQIYIVKHVGSTLVSESIFREGTHQEALNYFIKL